MTSVVPLRPSIGKEATTSPHSAYISARHFVCTFRSVSRVNHELDVGLFVDTTECLNGSPELGTKNRLSAWHLTSQETDALRFKIRAAQHVQGKGGHSNATFL